MPLQATSGAASYDAFGGGVPVVNYIEDVFSTYLFTGNGTSQTITNGIDLSTKGGLAWFKGRNNTNNHALYDTARGTTKRLSTSQTGGTGAQVTDATSLTAFNSNGFSVGSDNAQNENTYTFASWTFRKQPKFFDVVTWTGSSDVATSIGKGIVPHNLGSAPGCVIIKNTTSGSTNWIVYHRSLSGGYRIFLNTTDAQTNAGSVGYFSKYTDNVGWAQTDPDATNIYVGYNYQTNEVGSTMVAYLFAHNAGGFGLTGTDNVISCGTFTTSGTGDPNATVNLGYEPQWVMIKKTTASTGHPSDSWIMYDIMRGLPVKGGSSSRALYANASDVEGNNNALKLTNVGFNADTGSDGITYIYIACRRGPMKVPTLGTTVYNAIARSGNSTSTSITGVGFVPDLTSVSTRTPSGGQGFIWQDRLRSATRPIFPSITQAETTYANEVTAINQDGITVGTDTPVNQTGYTYINHFFGRAPSFFDEVCYTGTGVNRTVTHNLTAVPELMIVKRRDDGSNWFTYSVTAGNTYYLLINSTSAKDGPGTYWNSTTPTASVFSVGVETNVNANGGTFVAYLFATCAGVSKVGSYTGTGTTLQINCGFTAGARFVLIKRTDTTGDWYVWDTVRGIVSGNDPYLLLNSIAAEDTSTDYIDTYNAGFELSSTAPAAINASGGTFIFLAIA